MLALTNLFIYLFTVFLIVATYRIGDKNAKNEDAKTAIYYISTGLTIVLMIDGLVNATDLKFATFVGSIALFIEACCCGIVFGLTKPTKKHYANREFKKLDEKCSLFDTEDSPIYENYVTWYNLNNDVKKLNLTAKAESELAWLLAFLDSRVAKDYKRSPEICDRINAAFELFNTEMRGIPQARNIDDDPDLELKRWANQQRTWTK